MINKFIAELSDLGKILLAAAFFMVVVALFDLLLIGPTMSRMSAIDGEILKEKSAIKQDLHFLEYKDRILKESKALEGYVTQTMLSEEEVIAAFLKKVEMLANKANVTLVKVTPPVTGTRDKEYLKYQEDIECSGKQADIITFMHLVDTSTELMKVVKFNFTSKKADSDELKAVMSIVKVIVGKTPLPVKAPVFGDSAQPSSDAAAPVSAASESASGG